MDDFDCVFLTVFTKYVEPHISTDIIQKPYATIEVQKALELALYTVVLESNILSFEVIEIFIKNKQFLQELFQAVKVMKAVTTTEKKNTWALNDDEDDDGDDSWMLNISIPTLEEQNENNLKKMNEDKCQCFLCTDL